ncbi:hypothetical protein QA601_12550 [Chitinispirillales bacterium ANBcel5]|uniref:hypothetical protein n=1 Tax=Cellulosispirillum alkaliphilum TaxID=3039283 RepID=UPI002A526BBB|nr:hypothetical protein [Chitinispirillales bacterium ANBcel5]
MPKEKDQYQMNRNLLAVALFTVALLLLVNIVIQLYPTIQSGNISAVGHHHSFEDGSSYYIYTIFESNGDVYQCWWDEEKWNQKKVTNYKKTPVTGDEPGE